MHIVSYNCHFKGIIKECYYFVNFKDIYNTKGIEMQECNDSASVPEQVDHESINCRVQDYIRGSISVFTLVSGIF